MIRTHRHWMLVGLLFFCTLACPKKQEAPPPPPAPPEAKPPEPSWSIDDCPSRFAIAELKPDEKICPSPDRSSSWAVVPKSAKTDAKAQHDATAGNLNDGVDEGQTKGEPDTSPWQTAPGAAPFCVYTWKGKSLPKAEDFKQVKAEPECALATIAAKSDLTPEIVAPLARAFERHARGVAAADTARLLDAVTKPKPQVAIVDSTPFGLERPDTTGHGFAVSRVLASLACTKVDDPECTERVRAYLAMPLVWDKGRRSLVANKDGGYVGHFHNLFRAFTQALESKPADRKLVVNLSLGWDPIKTEPVGPPEQPPTSMELKKMIELLERASCEGVLVIAAAGNLTGTEGPLLPAGLETRRAPDAKRCEELGVKPPKPLAAAKLRDYRPLIHAVGAVDLYDQRLVTSRPWGQPRLAAYGLQVAAPAKTELGFSRPRNGTSMAAAIVSGIATAVWSLKPELDAHQVMALIYEGGRPLDAKSKNRYSRTEFCLDEDVPTQCEKWPVRRASLCSAINKAVSSARLKCFEPVDLKNVPADLVPKPQPPTDGADGSKLAAPCRTPDCGLATGPMSSQLIAGVHPQDGVVSCAACMLRLGAGRVDGLSIHGPIVDNPLFLISQARIYGYFGYWFPAITTLSPTPGNFQWFDRPVNMAWGANSGDIKWIYNLGIGSNPYDVTPLSPQP
jgi:hypothetical protein